MIFLVQLAVAAKCFQRTHTCLDALYILALYPLSLGVVYFLENVLMWD